MKIPVVIIKDNSAEVRLGDYVLYVLPAYENGKPAFYFAHARQDYPDDYFTNPAAKSPIWTGSVKLRAKTLSQAVREAYRRRYPTRKRQGETIKLSYGSGA